VDYDTELSDCRWWTVCTVTHVVGILHLLNHP